MQYSTQYQIRLYTLKRKKNTQDRFIHIRKPSRMYRPKCLQKTRLVAEISYICVSRGSCSLYTMQSCLHHPPEKSSAALPNTPSVLFLGFHFCNSTESCKLSQSSDNSFLRFRNVVVTLFTSSCLGIL